MCFISQGVGKLFTIFLYYSRIILLLVLVCIYLFLLAFFDEYHNHDTQHDANNTDIRFTPICGQITVPKLWGTKLMKIGLVDPHYIYGTMYQHRKFRKNSPSEPNSEPKVQNHM
jgi:hypothetical protein